MQFQRLATFILGIWLGVSVFMDFTATQNFQNVSRIMNTLDLRVLEGAKPVGGMESARLLLRYAAGEANRYLFEQWESTELGIGVLIILALLFSRKYQKFAMSVCAAMLAIVAVQRFKVTPAITAWGRAIDFTGATSEHFKFYHALYGYLEIGKLVLGLMVAANLLIRWKADRKTFVRQYERAGRVG
jgi:hypothetical protein